jgi:hypothetical protein
MGSGPSLISHQFSGYFPIIILITIYIPCQRAGGNRYGYFTDARYLRQDVLSMAETVDQFQVDIEGGKPDAKETYEDFKKHTEEHIAQLKQVRSLVIRNPYHLSEI